MTTRPHSETSPKTCRIGFRPSPMYATASADVMKAWMPWRKMFAPQHAVMTFPGCQMLFMNVLVRTNGAERLDRVPDASSVDSPQTRQPTMTSSERLTPGRLPWAPAPGAAEADWESESVSELR